jgi:hypothetical protein
MIGGLAASKFDETTWDNREHDWTGKAFYYIPIISVFNKPLNLSRKLDELNQGLKSGGYKPVSQMVLIEHSPFKGKMIVEVTKQDKYDANIMSFDIQTMVFTRIYKGDQSGLGKAIKMLKEMVMSRRSMEARAVYYLYIPGGTPGGYKTVLFAIT